jgi:hypothetical protein
MTQLTMFLPPIWRRSVSHHSRRNERPRTRRSVRFPTQPSKRAERPSPRSSASRLHLITVDVNGIVRKARTPAREAYQSQPSRTSRFRGWAWVAGGATNDSASSAGA